MSPIEKAAADALAAQRKAEHDQAVAVVVEFTGVPASSLSVVGQAGDTVVVTDGTVHLAAAPGGVSLVEQDGQGGWTQTAGPVADLAALGEALT